MKAVALLFFMSYCVALSAAPAFWYKWRSKVDGQIFCAQTSPGHGWERIGTPYVDARCSRPSAARR